MLRIEMTSKPNPHRRVKSRHSPRRRKGSEQMLLRLYVTGTTARSVRAIANLKRICEKYLKDGYSLEVVDIYQRPDLARSEQIVAVPTLIKCRPVPLKRWIGDLTKTERILSGLNLLPTEYELST